MNDGLSPPTPDPSGRRYLPPSGGTDKTPNPSGSAVASSPQGETDLVPGIVQDADTGRVLMLGYLNQEAKDLTLETGFVHFWSRSRRAIWKKGETSGNTLRLVSMAEDCDSDALLILASPDGPTCHTGEVSCFDGRELLVASHESAPLPPPSRRSAQEPFPQRGTDAHSLSPLWQTIQQRKVKRPDGSYTVQLIDGGVDFTGRKVLEEAGEVLMAAKDHSIGTADDRRVAEEAGDLIYHLLVLLAERDISIAEVFDVLKEREG
ncbi:MAG: bifunctional phosphoribosyl-AMP cyclohydrolase/phosphoribosyl-ATP diphosphatase HisIE [Acidimicrobiia bacterium]|nr:bifunctional phosphoribosyl-AMP cyclohydrolase/phosphoribosyl-ATP diphosphatase HisIE [Acidimicrobiia bacterium]